MQCFLCSPHPRMFFKSDWKGADASWREGGIGMCSSCWMPLRFPKLLSVAQGNTNLSLGPLSWVHVCHLSCPQSTCGTYISGACLAPEASRNLFIFLESPTYLGVASTTHHFPAEHKAPSRSSSTFKHVPPARGPPGSARASF